MANTYTSLHYHIIFSTKNREAWIKKEMEDRVFAYIGGIAKNHRMTALQVGGVDDHVHALVRAPPTIAPSLIVQLLKGESSRWIHDTFPRMRGFGWQDGYGAFTVSRSNLADVGDYIRTQREHHEKKSFQEEYRQFLDQHGIDYDERYVWG